MTQIKSLKNEDLEKIESFKKTKPNKNDFIDLGLLEFMEQLTLKYKCEVVAEIDRKGNVLDIKTGGKDNAKFSASGVDSGLCGIRIIHTHPFATSKLSDMDISALKNCKLDCMCAISVNEHGVYDAEVGFINGDKVEIKRCPNALYINKYGLMEHIYECDKIMKDSHFGFKTTGDQEVAIIVKVDFNGSKTNEEDLEELKSLANTAHIVTADMLLQKKDKPDARYLLGEGKLEELIRLVQLNNANIVIFYNELNGAKIKNLTQKLNCKVIDRSMLILDIFAGRARTSEGKLQVELAQLKYSKSRLNAYVNSDRFGGVGMRGPGETKLELNRRVVEDNILKKTRALNDLKKQRELNRTERVKNKKPLVAIVGYTNSGKSTLMNLLTKADVYAKNELFATLDTTTRNLFLDGKQLLIIDTVGFIKDLPHEFIEAFGSTLEECKYADILLNVIDISDPNHDNQEKVTLDTLKKLGCTGKVITVYNKIDKVKGDIEKRDGAVYISANKKLGIDDLKEKILENID